MATTRPGPIDAEAALAHVDALHRLARHLTGSANDAEDLVQETYARAFAPAARFESGTNLRAWLFRILRNTRIDANRRRRASPVRLVDDPDVLDEAPIDGPSLRGDAELELLRHAVAADIERALAELSEDARTVVLLDHEGFSETELADVLGCALGTVKSRLSRARLQLRARLAEYRR